MNVNPCHCIYALVGEIKSIYFIYFILLFMKMIAAVFQARYALLIDALMNDHEWRHIYYLKSTLNDYTGNRK